MIGEDITRERERERESKDPPSLPPPPPSPPPPSPPLPSPPPPPPPPLSPAQPCQSSPTTYGPKSSPPVQPSASLPTAISPPSPSPPAASTASPTPPSSGPPSSPSTSPPRPPTPPPPKSLYKIRFQRDKARMVAGWRRQVMEAETRVAVCGAKVRELEGLVAGEGERLKAALQELDGLERARQASVALNVWQPEVVRGRQKQIVEQCTVPIESRLGALKMEVRLCQQQIATYSKAYNDQKRKLSEFKESLTALKYQPLQINQSSATADDCNVKRKKKRRSDCHGSRHKE